MGGLARSCFEGRAEQGKSGKGTGRQVHRGSLKLLVRRSQEGSGHWNGPGRTVPSPATGSSEQKASEPFGGHRRARGLGSYLGLEALQHRRHHLSDFLEETVQGSAASWATPQGPRRPSANPILTVSGPC